MTEPKEEKTYDELAEEVLDIFREYRANAHDTKKILKLARKMVDRISVVIAHEEDAHQTDE